MAGFVEDASGAVVRDGFLEGPFGRGLGVGFSVDEVAVVVVVGAGAEEAAGADPGGVSLDIPTRL